LWIFHWRVGFPFSIAAIIVSTGGHPSSVHSNSITLTTESSAIGSSSYAQFLISRIKPTSLFGSLNSISNNTYFFLGKTNFCETNQKGVSPMAEKRWSLAGDRFDSIWFGDSLPVKPYNKYENTE